MFTSEKQLKVLYNIIIAILLVLFIYLLTKLFPLYEAFLAIIIRILTPFFIAGLIAFLLHPLIEKLHDLKYPRWLAIVLIYSIFFGGLGYLLYETYPVVLQQLNDLKNNLPVFMDQYRNIIYEMYEKTSFLPEKVHDKMDVILLEAENWLANVLTNAVKDLTKVMDVVIIVAVIPVIVFYMLKDFILIKRVMWKLSPKKYRIESKQLFSDIEKSLGDYIRGQLLVCLFVGLTSFLLLWLIGMRYPLLFSIIMGITNLIPYFGPILGAVPAVIIAFTMSTKMVVYVIISVFVVQIIEGNLLSPLIVGKSVHIHPLLIILALLVGGELGGIMGMILAVPVLTVLNVFFHHWNALKATR
ncbi:AI-2E family transporter [Radiobacillus kanasensis]|uniref:AI-2E family transporter n=1 Tax=Radiobacillus kanasensis TaxID=2844358 RepID=UPI001E56ED40|nr:AI-2E family transporter [Radiobacillus kanasensis]UFT97871.1 AI-2E family transporter [Radiobacillus kanasensis]